jgi:PPOX class probable F420-dependent enzyme
VTLDEPSCWARLAIARHGVLGTIHPDRGLDVVPVVFAVRDRRLVLPVDTVKPKRARRLQRLANLERDGRCVVLVSEYDEDWSRLWWVRVHGLAAETPLTDADGAALAERYPQYRRAGSISSLITVAPAAITGWSAS